MVTRHHRVLHRTDEPRLPRGDLRRLAVTGKVQAVGGVAEPACADADREVDEVLAQAVAYLDCEVRERLQAGDHTFFVGEVVDCGFLKEEETEVLRMEDTRMNYGG